MKKTLFSALLLSVSVLSVAQVGINTNDPKTTLDVNGSFATRESSVTISGSTATLDIKNAFYKITGGTANFTIVFSTTAPVGSNIQNGQRIVIYNDTNFEGTYNSFKIPSKTAQEFIYSGGAWYSVKAASNTPSQLKWFYAPSMILDTSYTTTARTYNIYENYKKQFTNTGTETNVNYGPTGTISTIPVYSSSGDLDYVITGYDKSVFYDVSINSSGILSYKVNGAATDKTFMNIVFVPKN